jgi:enterochelin esterase-like enzyme
MSLYKTACLFLLTILLPLIGGCGGTERPVAPVTSVAPAETTGAAVTQPGEPDIRKLSFQSDTLGKEMQVNVYVPHGYDKSKQYPVLYMLHGFNGTKDDWLYGIRLAAAADKLIEAGNIDPLIIVTPQLDNSYGLNSSDTYTKPCPDCMDEGRYEDYITKDLIAFTESSFSTVKDKSGRFIGGLSMGGHASLHAAFDHPDTYSRVGGHSPALFTDNWDKVGNLGKWLYPDAEKRKERDPLMLAESRNLKGMAVYLDCGDQDEFGFYDGSQKLNDLLKAKGVTSEFHLNHGKHESPYWQSHVEEYLLFYSGK